MADLGLETTERVLESLRQRLDRKALSAEESVLSSLKETLIELLEDQERALSLEQHKPFVILVVGVNGAGKNHHHWQVGTSVQAGRPQRDVGSGRYFPRGCRGATAGRGAIVMMCL